MAAAIDHLMWGAPSLESGMAVAADLFGVEPAQGGAHAGLGTCNALVALGDAYLEIIAPDPEQPAADNFAARLARLDEPALIAWAAGSDDLQSIASAAADTGLGVHGPVPTQRVTPGGETLNWELLYVHGHPYQGLVPFFIDWLECTHPASVNPQGGSLQRLSLRSGDAAGLKRLLRGLNLEIDVEPAGEPEMVAEIATDRGLVALRSTPRSLGLLFG